MKLNQNSCRVRAQGTGPQQVYYRIKITLRHWSRSVPVDFKNPHFEILISLSHWLGVHSTPPWRQRKSLRFPSQRTSLRNLRNGWYVCVNYVICTVILVCNLSAAVSIRVTNLKAIKYLSSNLIRRIMSINLLHMIVIFMNSGLSFVAYCFRYLYQTFRISEFGVPCRWCFPVTVLVLSLWYYLKPYIICGIIFQSCMSCVK